MDKPLITTRDVSTNGVVYAALSAYWLDFNEKVGNERDPKIVEALVRRQRQTAALCTALTAELDSHYAAESEAHGI